MDGTPPALKIMSDPVTGIAAVVEQALILANSRNATKYTREYVEAKKKITEEKAKYPFYDAALLEKLYKNKRDILDMVTLELINAQAK